MKPTNKSRELEILLEKVFGRTSAITSDICVDCRRDISLDYACWDEINKKEYTISGLCNLCQKKIFG